MPSRLVRLAGAALVAVIVALPTAPAVAAPPGVEDCLTVIGGQNEVDVAICAVLVTLPPDVRNILTPYLWLLGDPAVRCATAHLHSCDAAVCPMFAHLSGAPEVDVRADGDLYVAGEFVWDCPPYAVS